DIGERRIRHYACDHPAHLVPEQRFDQFHDTILHLGPGCGHNDPFIAKVFNKFIQPGENTIPELYLYGIIKREHCPPPFPPLYNKLPATTKKSIPEIRNALKNF